MAMRLSLFALLALTACSGAHDANDAGLDGDPFGFPPSGQVTPDAYTPLYPDGGSLVTTRCHPEAIPMNGFTGDEVYVESNSTGCGGGPCMVYFLVGNPDCTQGDARCAGPDQNACFDATHSRSLCVDVDSPAISASPTSLDRVFCTCRCSAGGNTSLPLCACPAGAHCVPDTQPGGGYCAPDGL